MDYQLSGKADELADFGCNEEALNHCWHRWALPTSTTSKKFK